MFDAFDIHLPALRSGGSIELRRTQTAFGSSEEAFVYVGDTKLARVVVPDDADQETGVAEQASSTLLLAAEVASRARARRREAEARPRRGDERLAPGRCRRSEDSRLCHLADSA